MEYELPLISEGMDSVPWLAYRSYMEQQTEGGPLDTFDWTAYESPSIAVVMSVAEEAAVDPMKIQPLQTVIDTDALDSFLQSSRTAQTTTGSVQFEYLGYRLLLDTDGKGDVYESEGSTNSGTATTRQTVSADQE